MKVIAVYYRNGRVVGCEMVMMGGKVYVPCTKCIQVHCPISQVEAREFISDFRALRKEGS